MRSTRRTETLYHPSKGIAILRTWLCLNLRSACDATRVRDSLPVRLVLAGVRTLRVLSMLRDLTPLVLLLGRPVVPVVLALLLETPCEQRDALAGVRSPEPSPW